MAVTGVWTRVCVRQCVWNHENGAFSTLMAPSLSQIRKTCSRVFFEQDIKRKITKRSRAHYHHCFKWINDCVQGIHLLGAVLKLFSCYVSSALNTVYVKHSGPLRWSSRSISIITPPTPTPHLGCNQILLTHTLTQDRRYRARFSYKFPMREHQTPPVVWQSSLLFPHPLLCPNAPTLFSPYLLSASPLQD